MPHLRLQFWHINNLQLMALPQESNSWDKAFDFAGNKYNDVFFEVMALREQLK